VQITTPLADPAIVLAIFSDDLYIVATDARPLGLSPSYWANPFMAGKPTSVKFFD
jgi:hypothetical protein